MAKIIHSDYIGFIDDYSLSKVVTMGNITELTVMQRPSYGSPCRKIDKNHYYDIRTGEVFEYKHIENRSFSLRSIRNTLSTVRGLINTNIVDGDFCRWVTLTYAENMTDRKLLYIDFVAFWKRFKRWCSKMDYGIPEYINVAEPQGRGAWHIHTFFIWSEKAPFIPNEIMASLWRHGFTVTKAVKDVDNIGAYFSAYLGDMPLDEVQLLSPSEQSLAYSGSGQVQEKEFLDEKGNAIKKRFVKGGRLFMYPTGMNIIRSSKGIKRPEVELLPYPEAKEKVSASTETFSRTYEILDDDAQVVNRISKTYYNSKRK